MANWTKYLLYKLFEVKSYYINVKLLIMYTFTITLPKRDRKDEELLRLRLSQLRTRSKRRKKVNQNKTVCEGGATVNFLSSAILFPYLPSSAGCVIRPDQQRSTTMSQQQERVIKYWKCPTNEPNAGDFQNKQMKQKRCSWIWQKDQT